MFKSATLYRINWQRDITTALVEKALDTQAFTPCAPTQEKSVGWIPVRGDQHGLLLESIGGQWIARLMVETRTVPSAAIQRATEERIQIVLKETGRKPGKKETREIKDDARLALMPQAFPKQVAIWAWIDAKAGLLVLDTASQACADEVITALVKALDGLVVVPINTQIAPAAAMATWLTTHEGPKSFSVDRECELKATDESKAVVRYTRHALDTEEVSQHIAMGKLPMRLALTWNDRVSLVLTEGLQLKKLAFLDVVFEGASQDEKSDAFDADVAITTGELGQLIPDLLLALGGEVTA